MYQIKCPQCSILREVKAKKPWMKGEQPYEKICKSCCQIGKQTSEETREKIRVSVKALQTDDVLKRKSEFMRSHPEFWKGNLKEGGAEVHCLGKKHTKETKKKISEGVKKAKSKENK